LFFYFYFLFPEYMVIVENLRRGASKYILESS